MNRVRLLVLGGLCLAISPVFAEDAAGHVSARFRSPKGQFEVGFQPQAERLYPGTHDRALPPGIQSQVYSVSFYTAGRDSAVAVTYLTDIQNAPQDKFPTPVETLAKQILWSPDEDFAVLPKENWHASGATAARQAVSLRTSSVWQTADFPFAENALLWTTPLQVIGNVVEGCRHDVRQFDGKSGRTLYFQTADPPEGYEILSRDDKIVVLKKVLGDCATEAQRQAFQPDCLIMNISFGRREIGTCPN